MNGFLLSSDLITERKITTEEFNPFFSFRLVQYACRMIWDSLDSSNNKQVDNKDLIDRLKNLESILSQFRKGEIWKYDSLRVKFQLLSF